MTWRPGLNEYAPIQHLALVHPDQAFRSETYIEAHWRDNEFVGAPSLRQSIEEYENFAEVVADKGTTVDYFPDDDRLQMAALYVRDASIVGPEGMILCGMRNAYRAAEPAVHQDLYRALGIPVVGAISGQGLLEGGDIVWLDEMTCAVARGHRTNAEGIRQLRALLGPAIHVEVVPLPHYKGTSEVLHLMSILSPLSADLALVYSRLMPVPFREWLQDRGIKLVELPDEEYDTQGGNVLAIAPRCCVTVEGNPMTRARLEAAGCEVIPFPGQEISVKGAGGPTCLTRPLVRA